MFTRNLLPVWIGIILLSGMFLMGQESWAPQPQCVKEGPFGDPTCSDGIDNDCDGVIDSEDPTCSPEDLDMTGADFECILNWSYVGPYYLTNKRGHLSEALDVANSPTGGTFPPGTIIQLFPTEAVVKRAPGWNPTTNDWEFFNLIVSTSGTIIASRGAENTVNRFGGNCFNCHNKAEPQWDLICDDNHGCDPLPAFVDDAFIQAAQQADPRCP